MSSTYRGGAGSFINTKNNTTCNNIERSIKSMKISDYYDPVPESLLKKSETMKVSVRPSSSVAALNCLADPLNGKGNLLDYEFPIKILDNLISVEEKMYGFSLFNRGTDLKKSLIDPTKVKEFIEKHVQE